MKEKMNKLLTDIWQWIYFKFIRPIKKRNRRIKFEREERFTQIALAKVMDRFEPMILRVYDEAIRDYNNALQQSFASKQAQSDIRKFLELKIKEFTNGIK